MVDISEINNQVNSLKVDLEPEKKQDNDGKCGSTDEIKNLIINIKVSNSNKIIQRLNESYKSGTEISANLMEEFKDYLTKGKFLKIKNKSFKF